MLIRSFPFFVLRLRGLVIGVPTTRLGAVALRTAGLVSLFRRWEVLFMER